MRQGRVSDGGIQKSNILYMGYPFLFIQKTIIYKSSDDRCASGEYYEEIGIPKSRGIGGVVIIRI